MEHLKSKHLTFGTLFCLVFKWPDHVIRQTIWQPVHLTTGHVRTIWIPNLSGIQMVTVLTIICRWKFQIVRREIRSLLSAQTESLPWPVLAKLVKDLSPLKILNWPLKTHGMVCTNKFVQDHLSKIQGSIVSHTPPPKFDLCPVFFFCCFRAVTIGATWTKAKAPRLAPSACKRRPWHRWSWGQNQVNVFSYLQKTNIISRTYQKLLQFCWQLSLSLIKEQLCRCR